MKSFFLELSIIIILSFLSLTPTLVKGAATNATTTVIELENPLKAKSFKELVYNLIDLIFTLALAIAPLMIIIAGFYFLIAAGEPAKINTAKTMILWTLIGLLIVLCAKGIITLFEAVFLPPPSP